MGPARSLSETSDVSAECSSGSMELVVAPLGEELVRSQQGPRTHFTRDMKTWPTRDSHIHYYSSCGLVVTKTGMSSFNIR